MTDDKDEIAKLEARLAELRAKAEAEATKVEPEASKVEPQATTGEPWSPTFTTPKPKPDNRGITWFAVVAIAIVGVLAVASTCKPTTTPVSTTTPEPRVVATVPDAEVVPPEPVSPWNYTTTKDPMNDSSDELACVTSTNQVRLDWPYSSVNARLCIRQTRRWGLDAYVSLLGDGQILCPSYDGCRVKVRFDTAEARNYSATGADDNSTNIVFISDGSTPGFVQNVKGADTTKIEIGFYQAGNQVLEFPTKGLEWPRPASPD